MSLHDLAYSRRQGFTIDYGLEIENEIARLQKTIDTLPSILEEYPSRWLALKLLEKDHEIHTRLRSMPGCQPLLDAAAKSAAHLRETLGEDAEVIIADHRYSWINGLVRETVSYPSTQPRSLTEQIDRVVMNRVLGIPIFLGMMWLVFKLTTDITAPLVDWSDAFINGPVSRGVTFLIISAGLEKTWVQSLVVDGIISGVGGVIVFVPVLMMLYLALAILEDSGYMARAAFVTDRLMHTMGLHGKSFLPMIVGFGCTVPAFYTTRTLENEKDRIITGLMVPFMSCGARLPIYVLFAAAFFPENSGGVIFALYLLGILTALAVGIILKYTLFKSKEQAPFVMELPPYRLPSLRGMWNNIRERTVAFVNKAFTAILAASVIIWLLLALPVNRNAGFAQVALQDSAFAKTASLLSPIFQPLGFGSWQVTGSLFSGLMGKEIIVSTLAQVYGFEDTPAAETLPTTFGEEITQIAVSLLHAILDSLKAIPSIFGVHLADNNAAPQSSALVTTVKNGFDAASNGHGKLAALAFMVFSLTYTPCVAALLAERSELGTRWMLLSIFGQFGIAWLLAFIVFQGGILLGIG